MDLQADGQFSERSPNYVAHVSVPSLLTLGRILQRPELIDAADRATVVQARLTDSDGMVESLASRRQDQFAPFDGGALHPWSRAHSARTHDPITARAARRTEARATADTMMTLLASSIEVPSALAPLPASAPEPTGDRPEVVELHESGLVQMDHGASCAVLFGGTDTADLGRITSGASIRPVIARFGGRHLRVRELRLARDFFSLGPLRPGAPWRLPDAPGDSPRHRTFIKHERVGAEYFHPLDPQHHDREGMYPFQFNGRFAAAMDFRHRPADVVSLSTSATARLSPGELLMRWEFQGPSTPICLVLALDGGDLSRAVRPDEHGRYVLAPADSGSTDRCWLTAPGERLEVDASGSLGGAAFYSPGEAYTVLSGSDEPGGDVLLIPASNAQQLTLRLRVSSPADDTAADHPA